jgi:hypothetical protein
MAYETEEQINRLIDGLCAARGDEAAAFEYANVLATAAPRPYSADKVREFCDAGELMRIAQSRKWLALDRVRDAYQAFGAAGGVKSRRERERQELL